MNAELSFGSQIRPGREDQWTALFSFWAWPGAKAGLAQRPAAWPMAAQCRSPSPYPLHTEDRPSHDLGDMAGPKSMTFCNMGPRRA